MAVLATSHDQSTAERGCSAGRSPAPNNREARTSPSAARPWHLRHTAARGEFLPPGISANAILRFCLKAVGHTVSDLVLGTGAYKSGIRATMFSHSDRGSCWVPARATARSSSRPRTSTARPPGLMPSLVTLGWHSSGKTLTNACITSTLPTRHRHHGSRV